MPLSYPSFPWSSGVEVYWTVIQTRNFPEAMSVAMNIVNGHWMKFSHIPALTSVNSGLDYLLQICEILLTGVHHLATI